MRLSLKRSANDGAVAVLRAALPPSAAPLRVQYRTRTGALLRIDGSAAGGFDREHYEAFVPPSSAQRELSLEVELQALPTNGLPSGDGVLWWLLNRLSRQRPRTSAGISRAPVPHAKKAVTAGLDLIGHSHLDVAWLWTYRQTRRKAQRTFAIACDLLSYDPAFVFAQSQPQLYAFVEADDPELFARVQALAAQGRFDPDVAALWVESDCNIPSGESLLRQMLFAHRYCSDRFGIAPSIAWLPDTFGFANTVPQLLAHAGIRYFATTKLQWNDTTVFPHPQFVWQGPDGSEVVSALIQSYDGGPYPWRVRRARERHEPLVLGYGDGGGGVTRGMLTRARSLGNWIRPQAWFDRLARQRDRLPVHRDELYLEFHRGVYTTHHDVKSHNALLERALEHAEELVVWCEAIHGPPAAIEQFRAKLHGAWEIVLRNQFHDVLPGTAITPVYRDALEEYAEAEMLVASVIESAQTVLPRARSPQRSAPPAAPVLRDGHYVFDNGMLRATVDTNGTIVELRAGSGTNLCTQANVLTLYRDVPKQWEAWNVDAAYAKRARRASPRQHRSEDGALVVDFMLGRSPASMRLWLAAGEPFLRVELDVEWSERQTLLRVENSFTVRSDRVLYGSPHGTIERSAAVQTPGERAKFEVPGQRFAAVRDAAGAGVALFSLDTYGWSARCSETGVRLGHSLLRGTTWPDARADLGAHRFSYAFAPFTLGIAALEEAWRRFALEDRVRLFTCDDAAVLVAACKPAEAGGGAVVRVRECEGSRRTVRLRCAARMMQADAVDGLERSLDEAVRIEEEFLVFELLPHQLRSFRIRF